LLEKLKTKPVTKHIVTHWADVCRMPDSAKPQFGEPFIKGFLPISTVRWGQDVSLELQEFSH